MRAALGLLLLLACGACAESRIPVAPTPQGLHVIHVDNVPVRARVAKTHAERAQGLMGVEQLADDEGMLFLYGVARRRTIWMKDCRMALDVAFADEDGRILEVITLQPPTTTGGRIEEARSEEDAVYVLEMGAGFFARHGLGPGSILRLPPTIDRSTADR